MIAFPNAKINLGLYITEKRSDGYHNIETVFIPISWCDALEVIENKNFQTGEEPCVLHTSGLTIDGDGKNNLLFKTYYAIREIRELPPSTIYLFKNIPMGAGLGGGSSDAAFLIKMLNEKFELELSNAEMLDLASKIGSDCAFFINNSPCFAQGKGNEFFPLEINLKGYHLLVIYPAIHSNTALAYAHVVPKPTDTSLKTLIQKPVETWKENIINDFEKPLFNSYPELEVLKTKLYEMGAVYASMSGSGSAVFGIFEKEPEIQFEKNYLCFIQQL